MADKDLKYELFAQEELILEHAQAFASTQSDTAYFNLVRDYEKLLKTTIKISKISDIQGRTLNEQKSKIQRVNEHLEREEQLRKQIISDICHELGSPMMAIQNYLKALIDGMIDIDMNYLLLMHSNLILTNQLIEDLFLLSTAKDHEEWIKFRKMSVGELVQAIQRKYFSGDEGGRGRVQLDNQITDMNAYELHIDPLRIEQVLQNLVGNALKYTPEGECVRIQLEVEAYLTIRVIDKGSGIDQQELPYLFDRYYRSTSSKNSTISGTGLGLAISREIIHKHGGEIGVTSEPGIGSTFYFTLPSVDRS
ncbi:Sensor histidine kinase YycG [compost metagenome]